MMDYQNQCADVGDLYHPLAAEEWLATCIALAANPRSICRLAVVNKNFCSVSISDTVWQKFLPPVAHLDAILSDMFVDANNPPIIQDLSKRQLYFRLCRGVIYCNGMKKFWLDQATGGECYMISARALSIAWGPNPQEWKPYPGAWSTEVAHLCTVCWFDVAGTFCQLLRSGCYVVSYRMQLHSLRSWSRSPVKLCVQNASYAHPPQQSRVVFDNANTLSSVLYLSSIPPKDSEPITEGTVSNDGMDMPWLECDVGEFIVEDENEGRPVEVHFSMREVEVLWWKKGFLLDGVIVRPKHVIDSLARARPEASVFQQIDVDVSHHYTPPLGSPERRFFGRRFQRLWKRG